MRRSAERSFPGLQQVDQCLPPPHLVDARRECPLRANNGHTGYSMTTSAAARSDQARPISEPDQKNRQQRIIIQIEHETTRPVTNSHPASLELPARLRLRPPQPLSGPPA